LIYVPIDAANQWRRVESRLAAYDRCDAVVSLRTIGTRSY
jgi:hypothetical protein